MINAEFLTSENTSTLPVLPGEASMNLSSAENIRLVIMINVQGV